MVNEPIRIGALEEALELMEKADDLETAKESVENLRDGLEKQMSERIDKIRSQ